MIAGMASLAPFLIVFGLALGGFAALRLLWPSQPRWLEAGAFSAACLIAWAVFDPPSWPLLQGRLFSMVHLAVVVLTAAAVLIFIKQNKLNAALWVVGLSWVGLSLVIWSLTITGTALTWTSLLIALALGAGLWTQLGRSHLAGRVGLFGGLLVAGTGLIAGFARVEAVETAQFTVLALLLAGGAVALYRPALMPHGVAGMAGVIAGAAAVTISRDVPAAIPALAILVLTLFSSQVVKFSKPPESGLEALGRQVLSIGLSAVPLLLAILVGYITLTNP